MTTHQPRLEHARGPVPALRVLALRALAECPGALAAIAAGAKKSNRAAAEPRRWAACVQRRAGGQLPRRAVGVWAAA